jgi:hypothetical protein
VRVCGESSCVYILTMHPLLHGPATVAELVEMLAWHGFETEGRASKAVSDALRWEIGRGRVRRIARALYGQGWVPRSTEYRIHQRVPSLRAELSLLRRANNTYGFDRYSE